MKILKRNSSEADFKKQNIIEAISNANNNVKIENRFTLQEIKDLAKEIEEKCKKETRTINVGDIQEFVEHAIMAAGKYEVATEYITYRYRKYLENRKNTTDDKILSLLKDENEEIQQENANKNPTIVSTQRDYIAGEVSKDIAKRYLIPSDISKAHADGVIHFHDTDYFAQPLHNCFGINTEFVTSDGIKKFADFVEGDKVFVKDLHGEIREATVHCYGFQECNEVTLSYKGRIEQKIICTPNHKWILDDGTKTENLQVNDHLYLLENPKELIIDTYEKARAWCLGFIIGDGCDHGNYTQVRLCGYKNKYLEYFKLAGFRNTNNTTGDVTVYTKNISKQEFLNLKGWRYLPVELKHYLFSGYYAADGNQKQNLIYTTDERVANMIDELSSFAGYYISSKKEEIRSTNYKENVKFFKYHFITNNSQSSKWKVTNIKKYRSGELKQVWCVNEPVTHTFTLASGIVTGNCDLFNLEDMLQNGTCINNKKIRKPHKFSTAATITSQISAVVASSQYGGQTFTLSHLAPFVEETRKTLLKWHKKHTPELLNKLSEDEIKKLIEEETLKDIEDGIQTLNYQLNTISTSNGQTPFVSVCMYLNEVEDEQTKQDLALIIEETLKQRIAGLENENGEPVTQAFPKLLYILEEDNITPDSKYYYLTELAAECTMKRMVPDYISEKVMKAWKRDKKNKKGYCFPTMGCRSILSVWEDPTTKKAKFYGRFNKGVVTINLPYVALESRDKNGKPNIEKFWYMLSEKLELCRRALRLRHEHLVGVKSDVAPILWQHGALARLKPGETIDKLLVGGYSTLSLGYVGLWETVKVLTGEDTWTENGHEMAIAIMKKLKETCELWDSVEHVGYSLYGTPEESTTYKFAVALRKTFGSIPGITDKNYVTNSYHVPVWEGLEDGMDAFKKIDIETEFQKYSTGGAISYIEAPITNNKEAILTIIKYIYDNIVYCEINNMGSCHCAECGTDGNVELVLDENGKYIWKCKNCGCTDLLKLTCVVRVCGYLSSGNAVNQGRLSDIHDRKPHI